MNKMISTRLAIVLMIVVGVIMMLLGMYTSTALNLGPTKNLSGGIIAEQQTQVQIDGAEVTGEGINGTGLTTMNMVAFVVGGILTIVVAILFWEGLSEFGIMCALLQLAILVILSGVDVRVILLMMFGTLGITITGYSDQYATTVGAGATRNKRSKGGKSIWGSKLWNNN